MTDGRHPDLGPDHDDWIRPWAVDHFIPKDRHPCPRIWTNDARQAGEPCIDGTRVTVDALANMYRAVRPESADESDAINRVREQYPTVTALDVQTAVAFDAGRRWWRQHSPAEHALATVRHALRACGIDDEETP